MYKSVVYVIVCTLPFSSYAFNELTFSEQQSLAVAVNISTTALPHPELYISDTLNPATLVIEPAITLFPSYLANKPASYSMIESKGKSGFYGGEMGRIDEQSYIQGTYVFASVKSVDVALTAKIEKRDQIANNYFYLTDQQLLSSRYLIGNTNTTLGIVGSYHINDNWAITGAVTTSSFTNEVTTTALVENELAHMALIGTSYSF